MERWERSLREYRERQRVERLEAWMVWHQSRARGFDRLSTEHREKAAQLADEQLMELEFEERVCEEFERGREEKGSASASSTELRFPFRKNSRTHPNRSGLERT